LENVKLLMRAVHGRIEVERIFMDPNVEHFHHLLQFLSLEPEDQIRFCAAALPDDASEWLPTTSDSDEKRYERFWTAQMGTPFDRCYLEYCECKRMFTSRDDYALPQDNTVLEQIQSVMGAMTSHKENKNGYNCFWGKNQLRNRKEWNELRKLARKALRALNVESRVPEEPFEHLLYVD
jgi:hypothetical protein